MTPAVTNLYRYDSAVVDAETTLPLIEGSDFRLEQIISRGHASKPGFWYDQPRSEWVLLLQGRARLEFENQRCLDLVAGDCLVIPARLRHRVASCSADAVWLGLHYR